MYQMIYRISINLYRYEYRIEKTNRYPALLSNVFRLKVDKSNTFQFDILPLYDEYIYIQNHKVLKC